MPEPMSPERRTELILEHLPRVRWIASQIHHKLPNGFSPLEDLVSVGIVGLIEAVDNFDPERGVKLTTYAEYRIRGAILDFVSGADGIPAHKRAKAKVLQQAISEAEQRLQSNTSAEDVAEQLGIPLAEYHALLREMRQVRVWSLESARTGERNDFPLAETLADESARPPYDELEQQELEGLVRKAFDALPPMERTVMTLYFREGRRLREIADAVDLHVTRISQLKAQATMRLRCFIMARWPVARGGAFARSTSLVGS